MQIPDPKSSPSSCPILVQELRSITNLFEQLKNKIEEFGVLQNETLTKTNRAERINKLKEIYKIRKQLRIEITESISKEKNYDQLVKWLKETKTAAGETLESKLEGGSFEELVQRQEKFYQESYNDPDFKIDRAKIKVDKTRLPAIAKGLESGAVNYPLIISTPERLKNTWQTEAEFAYHYLLEPLKEQGLKVNESETYFKFSFSQVLGGYIPVALADFFDADNDQKLSRGFRLSSKETDEVFRRIMNRKKRAPSVQEGQVKLVFTDARQDIPKKQKPVNQFGQEVYKEMEFMDVIMYRVEVLTPQEWITLAAQTFAKDKKTYLAKNSYEWHMALLDRKDQYGVRTDTPIGVARSHGHDDEICLSSTSSGGINTVRCSL